MNDIVHHSLVMKLMQNKNVYFLPSVKTIFGKKRIHLVCKSLERNSQDIKTFIVILQFQKTTQKAVVKTFQSG